MGIDYGRGLTNIDPETKIRYGVISMHSVMQSWCDSLEPFYPCKESECEFYDSENDECIDECGMCEPSTWYIDDDGYKAETCFDGTEIMIMKSPFFTTGAFCSPCVPGGINLNEHTGPETDDDRAYCFGHDWFDDGKAPYRVFSVETRKEVLP